MRLGIVEKLILGFIIFLFLAAVYFITELFIFFGAIITVSYGLGFAAEKILDYMEKQQQ